MNPTNSEIKIYSAKHLIVDSETILSPGAMAIEQDRIVATGTSEKLQAQFPEAKLFQYSDHVLMPGLVNAHADLAVTHFQPLIDMPYLGPDGRLFLMRWLVNVSRYKSLLSLPKQKAAYQQGLNIMKQQGVTTLGDQCRFSMALNLYRESGLRVVCLAEVENIQRSLAQEDFEQAMALIDELKHQNNPKITPGLAPFSAYTLSKNLLRILTNHALEWNIPIHIHAAFSFSEMEFFYDSMGEIASVLFKEAGWDDKLPPPHHMTSIQYLKEIGMLRVKPSVVGALHLGPTDAAILRNHDCWRIYAPQAFHYLQVGHVDWNQLMTKPEAWALGTHGAAAGSNLNLWEEMREVLRGLSEENQIAGAKMALNAATLGGAHVLGLSDQVGSLTSGKQADFIIVQEPQGSGDLLLQLILSTQPDQVQVAVVGGKALSLPN